MVFAPHSKTAVSTGNKRSDEEVVVAGLSSATAHTSEPGFGRKIGPTPGGGEGAVRVKDCNRPASKV
jgi:hypothetical protein